MHGLAEQGEWRRALIVDIGTEQVGELFERVGRGLFDDRFETSFELCSVDPAPATCIDGDPAEPIRDHPSRGVEQDRWWIVGGFPGLHVIDHHTLLS